MLFGADVTVAVQDPAYPVYVDTSVIMGMTGTYNKENQGFDNIEYMPCRPENDFFPDLSKVRSFVGYRRIQKRGPFVVLVVTNAFWKTNYIKF